MTRFKSLLVASWILLVGGSLALFFLKRDVLQGGVQDAFSVSVVAGCALYFLIGCLRGFTLIPSTYLVLAAVAFLPAAPLLAVTLAGIAVSSTSIYYFSAVLHLDEYFELRHPQRVRWIRGLLERYELPIIIGWSFFPLAPTDLICYVCGVLRVNFAKFLLGVCLGEGAICGIYIYFGDAALRFMRLK